MNSEKYSRGRRGAPAKGVGRATGASVQIPLSPLFQRCVILLSKKVVHLEEKNFLEKTLKKLLTNGKRCAIINKLSPRATQKNLDN